MLCVQEVEIYNIGTDPRRFISQENIPTILLILMRYCCLNELNFILPYISIDKILATYKLGKYIYMKKRHLLSEDKTNLWRKISQIIIIFEGVSSKNV